ncbi:two-component system, OmpR family, response regulator RegX3, partial [Candidatus Hakubella thermalkaliphila]
FDGAEALKIFRSQKPDLIILDLMLPTISGEEVCRLVRKESSIPIIMLTAKDSEIDRVVGLEIGADDYVTKPFSIRELVARVRALFRRTSGESPSHQERKESFSVGPFVVDGERHEIRYQGGVLHLPLKEFMLLKLLLRNSGRVLTREIILEQIWGPNFYGDNKTVDVHIRRLRERIEPDPTTPHFIKTVRGVGYRFDLENVD